VTDRERDGHRTTAYIVPAQRCTVKSKAQNKVKIAQSCRES